MGWKTLKERFKIEHIVQVAGKKIHIGSGYVSDLITIDVATGAVSENPTFGGFLGKNYPALQAASKEEILDAIQAKDVFDASIVVYTFKDGKVIEALCEKPGWPGITHDGQVMYENRFSEDKAKVIAWALRDAELGERFAREAVAATEEKLAEQRAYLAQCAAELADLRATYPQEAAQAAKAERD